MRHREPDWGVRLLLILGVVIVLAFSSLRLAAQTQPIAGLTSVAISAGPSGPPSLFPDGSGAAPGMGYASQPGLGCWRAGLGDMRCGGTGSTTSLSVQNSSGIILGVGQTSVTGIWTFTNGGALQNVSSTSGTIVMATTTIFNASGTLTNVPMNFNDLNLFLTVAGQQGWCRMPASRSPPSLPPRSRS